jgi:hypothetical protein
VISLGLDLGCRLMPLPLTYAKDDSAAGIRAGDAVKNTNGKAMKMDVSGFIVAMSVTLTY